MDKENTQSGESRGVAMNMFAIFGFIAILLAGLWATSQLVRQASNMSFNFSKPNITMPTFGLGNDDDDEATTTPEVVDVVATTTDDSNTTDVITQPSTKGPSTNVASVRKSNAGGMPDLVVNILEVGAVDSQGNVSVRFEVANIGTKMVSGWTFSAVLPTDPTYTYASNIQGSLYAGERAEMLITFDKLKTGTNTVLITADALNLVPESVEGNNSDSETVVVI